MANKLIAAVAAASLALASALPSSALARDRGGDGWRGERHHYDRDWDRRHHRGRHDDNDVAGAAIAAGVIGLALGAMLMSAAADDDNRSAAPPPRDPYYGGQDDIDPGYYDRAPPPAAYNPPPPNYAGEACVRQVEQYDPYSGRYVWVNLRTQC